MANEIDLNDLTIKTDSLPDNWKMMIIDPTTGLPARNMTVARFVELFTPKQPVATGSSNGLMSYVDRVRFPVGVTRDKSYQSMHIAKFYPNTGAVILLAEASTDGRPGGFGILQISGSNNSMIFTYTTFGYTQSAGTEGVISTPVYTLKNSDGSYDIYAKDILMRGINGFGVFALATSREMDLYKVDDIPAGAEAVPQQRFSVAQPALSTFENALTDTISTSPVLESRQVRSTCLQNHLYQILLPTCLGKREKMVQFSQLKRNHQENSMSGQSTRSEKLSWSYRKKTRDLNKSSISLTIARYNKCNLPRAGPPRLIN